MQEVLREPMARMLRNQDALSRAVSGPYSAILRQQDLVLQAMTAVAGALDDEETVGADQVAWTADWLDGLRDWTPSPEAAAEFLNALAFIVGILAFAITLAGPDTNVDELLTAAGLLFTAGAYAIRKLHRGN